jgi:tetratricopeptide (TPR) repeat protein
MKKSSRDWLQKVVREAVIFGVAVSLGTLVQRWYNPKKDLRFDQLSELLRVEEDLSEMAGFGDTDKLLLDTLETFSMPPKDRAMVKYRRCGLVWSLHGPDAALGMCEEAEKLDPTNFRIHTRIVRLLDEDGRHEEALKRLSKWEADLPKSPEEEAMRLWAAGRVLWPIFETRIVSSNYFKKALTILPTDSDYQAIGWWELSRFQTRTGDFKGAKESLEMALARQRSIVRKPGNVGYSEYELYLARMLILSESEASVEEGKEILKKLRSVERGRYEYSEDNPNNKLPVTYK